MVVATHLKRLESWLDPVGGMMRRLPCTAESSSHSAIENQNMLLEQRLDLSRLPDLCSQLPILPQLKS
jgi:hypothetical protein